MRVICAGRRERRPAIFRVDMVAAMRSRRMITVVGCHAGGEIGYVIVGGVLPPRGETVFEQMQTLQREHDWLRRLLLHEPRGSVAVHANRSSPRRNRTATPVSSSWNRPNIRRCRARTRSAPPRSCSKQGWSRCGAETSSGWRRRAASSGCARCRDGRCESVEFTNVPCFADRLDAPLEVEGLGTLTVDVAYGGIGTRSPTRKGSASRSSRTRRVTCRSWERPSAPPPVSSFPAYIRRTRPSPESASSRSQRPGRASAK